MHITFSSTHRGEARSQSAFISISGIEIGKKAAVTPVCMKNISVVVNLCNKYTANKDLKQSPFFTHTEKLQ